MCMENTCTAMSPLLICLTASILGLVFAAFQMVADRDYVIRVYATCGERPQQPTRVTVLADLQDAEPLATCRDGHVFPLQSVSSVEWRIDVTANDSSESGCTFQKRHHVDIYSVMISVTVIPGLDDSKLPPYLVTCVYATHALGSTTSGVDASKMAVSHVLQLVGPTSEANVDLLLLDEFDQPVKNAEIGQTVRLTAHMTESDEEQSMRAEYCYAAGENNNTYYILQSGCGDGVIIPKDRGFETNGSHVTSPFFQFFGIPDSTTLAFNCLFVLCSAECDGSSCVDYP